MHVTKGFKLRVRGGLLVALSYALDFHLLDPIQYRRDRYNEKAVNVNNAFL